VKALLNIDAGEHEDEPLELYELADLVHVACGGHAGDDASMDRVVRACVRTGTRIGAHPSYADREGFGRRSLPTTTDALASDVREQIARLRKVANAFGATLTSVKLHGALYHDANASSDIAGACLRAIADELGAAAVVGPARGALATAAARDGRPYLREAFADRGTRADGTLVPRGEPGALIDDPRIAAGRARDLAASDDVDTICIHSDTPGALAIARAVRDALGPRA
jgi:UPF0271 protein